LEELLAQHRAGLRHFVEFHLDPRLRARVDPSDVVQDTQLELVRRIDDFLARRPMPFHLWMRKKAYERLLNLRRDHVLRQRRAVGREIALAEHSSLLLAKPLLAKVPTPSQVAEVRELTERVGRAVAHLSEVDREILLMRHGEELPFEEIACLLDIEPAAARKRFGRALLRLRKALSEEGLLGAVR
jgi:RNA polymerase sigma-70 factor (ECF subfamily)